MTRDTGLFIDEVMEAEVVFRCSGPSVDPDEITAVLGVSPTRMTRRSERTPPRPSDSDDTPPSAAKGRWVLRSSVLVDSRDLAEHAEAMAAVLNPHREFILSIRQRPGTEVVGGIWIKHHDVEHDTEMSGPAMASLAALCDRFVISFCGRASSEREM